MEQYEFSTLKDFRKAYNAIREIILIRHGYKKGDKVKLKNAVMLYQKFDDHWVKCNMIKSDMEDKIKMYEACNKEVYFKLVSLV